MKNLALCDLAKISDDLWSRLQKADTLAAYAAIIDLLDKVEQEKQRRNRKGFWCSVRERAENYEIKTML